MHGGAYTLCRQCTISAGQCDTGCPRTAPSIPCHISIGNVCSRPALPMHTTRVLLRGIGLAPTLQSEGSSGTYMVLYAPLTGRWVLPCRQVSGAPPTLRQREPASLGCCQRLFEPRRRHGTWIFQLPHLYPFARASCDAIRRDAGRGATASLASNRGVQTIRYFCLSVTAAILFVPRCKQHHTIDTRQNMAFIDCCPERRLLRHLESSGAQQRATSVAPS
jgi:hypothetical protein